MVIADADGSRAEQVASETTGTVVCRGVDVTDSSAVEALIARTELKLGPIGLWCGNAGAAFGAGLGADLDWERSWRLHVLAHVATVRTLVPRMIARGSGHVLITASAAGLLTSLDTAAYAVSKHAAVGFAEWLAIPCAEHGVTVSCLCPQAVRTPLIEGRDATVAAAGEVLEPDAVALLADEALAEDRFLVLPHPEVAEYERRKVEDRDRWLRGMARLRDGIPGLPAAFPPSVVDGE